MYAILILQFILIDDVLDCALDCVVDEQHFVFDCPAYSHIRSQHLDLLQHCCAIADFVSLYNHICEPNACGGFLRECFACGKQFLTV